MSRQAVEWAYQQECGSAAARFLLVTIADYADEAETCFPGQHTLAERCDMSVRTVRTHIATLEQLGLLRRESRVRGEGRGRGRTSDRFVLAGPTGKTFREVTGEDPGGTNTPPEAAQDPSEPVSTGPTTDPGPTGNPRRQVERPTGNPRTTNRQPDDDQPAKVAGHELEVNRQGTTSGGATTDLGQVAKQLVTGYVAACGKRPPTEHVSQVAYRVGTLLGDGIDHDDIAGALQLLVDKGLHPTVLPALVEEHRANQRRAAPKVAQLEDARQRRLAGARDYGRQLAELDTAPREAADLIAANYPDDDLAAAATAAYDASLDAGGAL